MREEPDRPEVVANFFDAFGAHVLGEELHTRGGEEAARNGGRRAHEAIVAVERPAREEALVLLLAPVGEAGGFVLEAPHLIGRHVLPQLGAAPLSIEVHDLFGVDLVKGKLGRALGWMSAKETGRSKAHRNARPRFLASELILVVRGSDRLRFALPQVLGLGLGLRLGGEVRVRLRQHLRRVGEEEQREGEERRDLDLALQLLQAPALVDQGKVLDLDLAPRERRHVRGPELWGGLGALDEGQALLALLLALLGRGEIEGLSV